MKPESANKRYKEIISEPPKSVELQLTYSCNLRCRMCGQWGPNGIFKKNIHYLKKQGILLLIRLDFVFY